MTFRSPPIDSLTLFDSLTLNILLRINDISLNLFSVVLLLQ